MYADNLLFFFGNNNNTSLVSSRPPLSAQGLIKTLSFINYYLEMKDETVIKKDLHKTHL